MPYGIMMAAAAHMTVIKADIAPVERNKMKTREEVILSMCYTYRHDYGLTRASGDVISSGINQSEREYIYDRMAQIFDRDIAPYMDFKRPSYSAHSCDIEGCAVCDPTYGL
jgi:hypothetical protein